MSLFGHGGMMKRLDAAPAQTPIDVTATSSTYSNDNTATYNFGSLSIGVADTSRVVVIAFGAVASSAGSGSMTVTSVTVGGVTATIQVQETYTYNANAGAVSCIASVHIPTGTAGVVIVALSHSCLDAGVGVYRMVNASGIAAYATASASAGSGNQSVNVNVEAGGVIIACGTQNGTTTGNSWTGLNEDYEQTPHANRAMSGAHNEFASAQTPQTVTFNDDSVSTNMMSAVSASWSTTRPVDVTYTDNTESTTDLTTYNFGSQAIGTPDESRIVVVGITATDVTYESGDFTVDTVNIGGSAASILVQETAWRTGNRPTVGALAALAVPTGTSLTVQVIFNEQARHCGIIVWRMVHTADATAYATAKDDTGDPITWPISGSVNCEADGAVIGLASVKGSSSVAIAWTGLSEDVEDTVENQCTRSGAHDEHSSAQTPDSISVNITPSGGNDSVVVTAAFSKET